MYQPQKPTVKFISRAAKQNQGWEKPVRLGYETAAKKEKHASRRQSGGEYCPQLIRVLWQQQGMASTIISSAKACQAFPQSMVQLQQRCLACSPI
jgi:hypothetical protein